MKEAICWSTKYSLLSQLAVDVSLEFACQNIAEAELLHDNIFVALGE